MASFISKYVNLILLISVVVLCLLIFFFYEVSPKAVEYEQKGVLTILRESTGAG